MVPASTGSCSLSTARTVNMSQRGSLPGEQGPGATSQLSYLERHADVGPGPEPAPGLSVRVETADSGAPGPFGASNNAMCDEAWRPAQPKPHEAHRTWREPSSHQPQSSCSSATVTCGPRRHSGAVGEPIGPPVQHRHGTDHTHWLASNVPTPGVRGTDVRCQGGPFSIHRHRRPG